MQTGHTLYRPVSEVKHAGPVTAVHVCEGQKKSLAICGSEDHKRKTAVYVYDFEMGNLLVRTYDHTTQVRKKS